LWFKSQNVTNPWRKRKHYYETKGSTRRGNTNTISGGTPTKGKGRNCEKLEFEIVSLWKELKKKTIEPKFKKSVETLDDIINCQSSPFINTGLRYDKSYILRYDKNVWFGISSRFSKDEMPRFRIAIEFAKNLNTKWNAQPTWMDPETIINEIWRKKYCHK